MFHKKNLLMAIQEDNTTNEEQAVLQAPLLDLITQASLFILYASRADALHDLPVVFISYLFLIFFAAFIWELKIMIRKIHHFLQTHLLPNHHFHLLFFFYKILISL